MLKRFGGGVSDIQAVLLEEAKELLEDYRKCVHEILDLIKGEIVASTSAENLKLMSNIVDVIKGFNNIYESHQPWNYKK